jgi:hypothetical protein
MSGGTERNTKIVKVADMLIAFWDGKSRGTSDSINKAFRKGIPLILIMIDGENVKVTGAGLDEQQQRLCEAAEKSAKEYAARHAGTEGPSSQSG